MLQIRAARELDLQAAPTGAILEFVRSALLDDSAVVDDDDEVGQFVGFFEVLRALSASQAHRT